MLNRAAAALSVRRMVVMMLMILWMGVDTAPTVRDPALSLTGPGKTSGLNLSQYLKQWIVTTKAAGADGTTKTTTRTLTAGTRAGRPRNNHESATPEKKEHMLKMISALEELHRTFNSTLSSRITIMPRGNGRNSGRKNKAAKLPPAADGGLKTTTAPPADSTVSRTSADVGVPSLTGRNFKKSLPPPNRKTNKRVCFWKYCSQN
ncbi:hypothetical protein JOB18_033229 [Solea senegalensis]|uniref:Urotensin II-related peptide n=1 Tax=Solea senegalensis TaxID=28829 RepID=A0AAV6RCC1_SOLSE|nr:hypothetical protein JOB18_033229 [Solea senegalensis]